MRPSHFYGLVSKAKVADQWQPFFFGVSRSESPGVWQAQGMLSKVVIDPDPGTVRYLQISERAEELPQRKALALVGGELQLVQVIPRVL